MTEETLVSVVIYTELLMHNSEYNYGTALCRDENTLHVRWFSLLHSQCELQSWQPYHVRNSFLCFRFHGATG